MKLISYIDQGGRVAGTVATDMDIAEWYAYWYTYVAGHNFAITHVSDLSEADFRQWKIKGFSSITRQEARIAHAANR